MSRQNGFTLIELMTTLGIAAILVAVAIPGMQAFELNSRQSGSLNELVSGMRIARSTAITTNTRVTVCASSNGTSCNNAAWDDGWIAFVDNDADRSVDVNERILRTGEPVDGIRITSGQFANFFVYRPNGRVMYANVNENSGQFVFCDRRGSDHAKGINVDLSGRPRYIDAGLNCN